MHPDWTKPEGGGAVFTQDCTSGLSSEKCETIDMVRCADLVQTQQGDTRKSRKSLSRKQCEESACHAAALDFISREHRMGGA